MAERVVDIQNGTHSRQALRKGLVSSSTQASQNQLLLPKMEMAQKCPITGEWPEDFACANVGEPCLSRLLVTLLVVVIKYFDKKQM